MNLDRWRPWMALLTIAMCVLSSCGRTNSQRSQREVLRVGYIPVTHCIPLYVAVRESCFATEGLDVRLISLPSGPKIIEALASHDIDVGFTNVVSMVQARSRGIPVVAVTGGPVEDSTHRDHAILVRSDSGIKTIAALRGRKIAVNGRRGIDHLMIALLLQQNGLTEADVSLVEIPFPSMLGALAGRSVDAIATAEPFVSLAGTQGGTRVLSWNYVAVRPATDVATYVTTLAELQKRQATIIAFQRCISKAAEIAESDPASARAALRAFTTLNDTVVSVVSLPRFAKALDKSNLAETITAMRRNGFLDVDMSPDSLAISGAIE